MGLTRTFNFVTRDSWISGREETDEDAAVEIERLLAQAEAEANEPAREEGAPEGQDGSAAKPSASDEAVFAKSYIPRTLDDVYDAERDVQRVLRGEGKDLIYADITGVASIHGKANAGQGAAGGLQGVVEEEDSGGSDAESEDDDEDSDEEDEDGEKQQRPKGKKFEDKEEKKVRALPPPGLVDVADSSLSPAEAAAGGEGAEPREARDQDEEEGQGEAGKEDEREAMKKMARGCRFWLDPCCVSLPATRSRILGSEECACGWAKCYNRQTWMPAHASKKPLTVMMGDRT